MSEPIDISALRAALREYDPYLPRCPERVKEHRNYAPDYTPEDERALWDMPIYTPCCRPEGHEGACRNSRLVLGFPGLKNLTALIDEIERLRAELGRATSEAFDLGVASGEGRERAAVVACLRAEALEWDESGPARLALRLMSDAIERSEHHREEE